MNGLMQRVGIVIFFPWLSYFPFVSRLLKIEKIKQLVKDIDDFTLEKIEEHRATLDINNPRDFIDCYLIETATRRLRDPHTTLAEDCLSGTIQSFFNAGSETVRASIEWAFYAMALFPDMQKKVHAELDSIIGRERSPKFEDLKDLPYVQAVLTELQRWKTTVPMGPFRSVLADVDVLDYTLPKGTLVIPNIQAVHNDPLFWDEPKKFIPERFLTTDGKFLLKSESYLPFTCGKRACPGEALAITEIFLYFTWVLQKYTLHLPESHESDFAEEITIVLQPKSPHLIFTPRN